MGEVPGQEALVLKLLVLCFMWKSEDGLARCETGREEKNVYLLWVYYMLCYLLITELGKDMCIVMTRLC